MYAVGWGRVDRASRAVISFEASFVHSSAAAWSGDWGLGNRMLSRGYAGDRESRPDLRMIDK